MRAAVEAERARAAAQEQGRTTKPQANGHTKRSAKPESAAKTEPESAVEKGELPQRVKPTVTPQPVRITELPQRNGHSKRSTKPWHARQPESAVEEGKLSERLKPAVPARPGRQARPRPSTPKKRSRHQVRARLLALAAVTLVAVGALAIAAVKHFAHSPSSAKPSSTFMLQQEVAARQQAAVWVAQQVSRDVTVSCDKVMCAALAARGFPSRDLVVLGSATPYPVPSVVVVDTAAVRDMFGTSLATAWAPAVLASFGTGTTEITVRVVAPHGALAYQEMLSKDLATRKDTGAALLNDAQIKLSMAARNQLIAGRVDTRLVWAIASVAVGPPIDIVQFGNIGQGASAGLPLRFADLAVTYHAADMTSSAYVRSMRASLNSANIPYHPVRAVTVVLPDGQTVFRVEFTGPSPFGVLSPQGSS
jgi:hypothetical protein